MVKLVFLSWTLHVSGLYDVLGQSPVHVSFLVFARKISFVLTDNKIKIWYSR